MDFTTQAPEDQELKLTIDKLAQFVARNGADFERITKEKQKNNPRFSFLFGGEFYNYYQYRLTTEQAVLRKQQSAMGNTGPFSGMPFSPPGLPQTSVPPPHLPPGNFPLPAFVPPWTNRPPPGMPPVNLPGLNAPISHPPHLPPPHIQMQQLQRQLDELQEQINSSDRNLAAQRESLMTQKQDEIEQLRLDLPRRTLQNLVNNTGIALEEFESIVQPVIEACTKDNIAMAKNFVLARLSTSEHFDLFSLFLFHRAITLSTSGFSHFEHCLHLVYLVNDLLHHVVRKNMDQLRISLRRVIPALFSEAMITSGGEEEKVAKLTKLINLWRQNCYLDEQLLTLLEDTNNRGAGRNWFLSEIMHSMMPVGDSHFSTTCSDIEKRYNLQYCQLEQQNNEYAAHVQNQMQQVKQLMQSVAQQMQGPPPMFPQPPGPAMMGGPPSSSPWSSPPPPLLPPPQLPPPLYVPPPLLAPEQPQMIDTSRPPPSLLCPPGFNGPMPPQRQPTPPPLAPYYDLPAGLIVPLIKPEDNSYEPIDTSKVQLPPPCPPTERLLAAVEAFYAPPSHDNPRDSEGWERLGLYEFFQAKERAINEAKQRKREEKLRETGGKKVPRSRSKSSSRSGSGSPVPYLRSSRSRSRSPNSDDGFKGRHSSSSSKLQKISDRRRRSVSSSSSNSPR